MDRQLGAFEILPDPRTGQGFFRLGEGTFGITYKAKDRLGHEVALKNLKFEETDPKAQRFENEAKVLYKLKHPHVASFLHYDIHKGYPYCCMEFCPGGNLQDIAREQKGLPAPVLLEIGRQVCSALAYAHERPDGAVIHRDIKPENLMLGILDSGDVGVKVIDFGLAKVFSGEEEEDDEELMRSAEGFKGTSLFASPEQWRETEIDGRADCYSLGMTLWFLASGRKPDSFENKSLAEVSAIHLSPQAFDLGELDALLRPLLQRLLAKDPEERFADSREALGAFSEAVQKAGFDEDDLDLSQYARQEQPFSAPLDESPIQAEIAFEESRYVLREKWWEASVGPVYGCRTPEGDEAFLLFLEDGNQLRVSAGEREDHYRQVLQLQQASASGTHPATLIETKNFHWFSDGVTCVALEPLWAVSLREVIRRRRKFSFDEALMLLQHLAVAMDYLDEQQMPVPDLSDSRLLVCLADPSKFSELGDFIEANLDSWPRFVLKVLPLSSSETEGGSDSNTTDVTSTYDAAEESAAFNGLSRFAAKIYSLLAGHQVAHAAFFTYDAYSEIPGLSADGNALLQDVICARGSISASCRELLLSLCRSEGVAPPETLVDTSLVSGDLFRTVIEEGDPEPGLSSVDPSMRTASNIGARRKAETTAPEESAAQPETSAVPGKARPLPVLPILVIVAVVLVSLGTVLFFKGFFGPGEQPEVIPVEDPGAGTEVVVPSDPVPEPPVVDESRPAPPGTGEIPEPRPDPDEKDASPQPVPGKLIVPETVATLAEAIEKAKEGATIEVRGGEYRVTLRITKPVTIIGSDQAEVLLLAPSENESVLEIENTEGVVLRNLKFEHPGDQLADGDFPPILLIRSSEVEITGCQFQGGAGDGAKATGEGAKVTIADCDFVANAQHGLFLERGAVSEVSESRFERNGGSGLVAIYRGTSVQIGEGSSFVSNGVHGAEVNLSAVASFRGCSFGKNQKAGMFAEGAGTSAVIDEGVFTENLVSGIQIQDGAVGKVRDSEVKDNEETGIAFVNPGSGSQVAGNQIIGNIYWGISVLADKEFSITIENNKCQGSGYGGIIVEGEAKVSIAGNDCSKNKEHGIELTNGTSGEVTNNTCRDNADHGIILRGVSATLVLLENDIADNGRGEIERL